MKSLLQKSRLGALVEQRNAYLSLSFVLGVLSILLTVLCFYLSNREKVVLVPPEINKSFWVGKDAASPEYISEMTRFFAYLRFNLTADNADEQRTTLLRYVDPSYYGELNNELISERDQITKDRISMSFFPNDIKVDEKNLRAQIVGDIVVHVGNAASNTQRVSYQLDFRYNNGRLLVSKFKELKV